MERLTKYGDTSHENKVCCTHFMGKECFERLGHCTDNCPWEEAAWSKLAAYEETGLEPEEIEKLCDMDRRAKMAEMLRDEEKNGISIDRLRELVEADKDGRCVVLPVKLGTEIYSIRNKRVPDDEYRMSFHNELSIISQKFCLFHTDLIGKTVFLTREEAEKALQERREQDE